MYLSLFRCENQDHPGLVLKNDESLALLKFQSLGYPRVLRINDVLSCVHNKNTQRSMSGILVLLYWECQVAVMVQKPMEQPSLSVVGLLIQTSLFNHTILFRVIKPFYNTAVSLFYSLIEIATNFFFQCSIPSLCMKVLLCRPTNQLEVNYIAFHISLFPQVLNKGSKKWILLQ